MKGCLNPKKQFEEGQQDWLVQQFRLQRPQRFEVIHWGRTSFSSPHWRGIKETLFAGCHRVAMSIVVIQAKKFKRSNHYTGQPHAVPYLLNFFKVHRICCCEILLCGQHSTIQLQYIGPVLQVKKTKKVKSKKWHLPTAERSGRSHSISRSRLWSDLCECWENNYQTIRDSYHVHVLNSPVDGYLTCCESISLLLQNVMFSESMWLIKYNITECSNTEMIKAKSVFHFVKIQSWRKCLSTQIFEKTISGDNPHNYRTEFYESSFTH